MENGEHELVSFRVTYIAYNKSVSVSQSIFHPCLCAGARRAAQGSSYIFTLLRHYNQRSFPTLLFTLFLQIMSKKGKKKNGKSNNLLDRLEECDRGGQFELDLSQLKLELWPTETMVVPNIATLKAYGNLWNTVPNLDTFRGLESIDLSRCKITNLDESNLTGLHKLKFLDLSRNELTEIPDDITHLPLLQDINLSRNQISKLPNDVKGMVSVRVIDLSNNSLKIVGNVFDE